MFALKQYQDIKTPEFGPRESRRTPTRRLKIATLDDRESQFPTFHFHSVSLMRCRYMSPQPPPPIVGRGALSLFSIHAGGVYLCHQCHEKYMLRDDAVMSPTFNAMPIMAEVTGFDAYTLHLHNGAKLQDVRRPQAMIACPQIFGASGTASSFELCPQ